ncbi:hypothetical protein D3C86_1972500 [compost metagenome]
MFLCSERILCTAYLHLNKTMLCKLKSIGQQITQNLMHPHLVREEQIRYILFKLHRKLQMPFCCCFVEVTLEQRRQFSEIDSIHLHLHFACLYFGKIKNVIDHGE